MEEIEGDLCLSEEDVLEIFLEGVVDYHEDGKEVVLEGEYGTFISVASLHVCGYKMVCDIPVFLDDTIVFDTELVINNLEVDLVALQSEAVHDGILGCNEMLVSLVIEGGNKDCVGITMLGGQDVLINTASSGGDATRVVYV